MDKSVKRLADALRLAERAHAQWELKEHPTTTEWPEFYAQWLMDNVHIWAATYGCDDGSCEVHHG